MSASVFLKGFPRNAIILLILTLAYTGIGRARRLPDHTDYRAVQKDGQTGLLPKSVDLTLALFCFWLMIPGTASKDTGNTSFSFGILIALLLCVRLCRPAVKCTRKRYRPESGASLREQYFREASDWPSGMHSEPLLKKRLCCK